MLTKKQKDFLKVLSNYNGIITPAAKHYGITPGTHYVWMKNEEYAAAYQQIRYKADDFVESKLFDLINDGDTAATLFYAKTRMRYRGFSEKQDVDVTSNGKTLDNRIQIEVITQRNQVDENSDYDSI